MEQGCGVDEFDDAGKGNVAIALVAAQLCRKEQQHGTNSLAAAGKDILSYLADQIDI